MLIRRGHFQADGQLKSRSTKVIVSAAIMAAGLWFGADQMRAIFESTELIRAVALTSLVAGGLILFFGCAQLTGAIRIADLKYALRRS